MAAEQVEDQVFCYMSPVGQPFFCAAKSIIKSVENYLGVKSLKAFIDKDLVLEQLALFRMYFALPYGRQATAIFQCGARHTPAVYSCKATIFAASLR